ncbi:hypothetical protein C1645_372348 [Glomus cerebriforme]|uniref:CUE domain-containing protein n=1 Tax=Glomus cerebriforme TaxID=658196 RepID=A0A397SMU1_9GLOM|nr:hypothetical protein C1645_795140 [Glomus cerebriforme]RIA85395.1 hypothetical protein C1645_372348 [Glomus cerebriforme]
MSHKSKCGTSCHEDKNRYRIEKREEKQRQRQEKKEEKNRHRQEKKERKQRHREEKRRHRDEFFSHLFNISTSSSTTNVVVGHPSNLNANVRYNNFNEIPLERIEHDVATLRTIFPDCDPEFIRNCLANESGDDRVRKIAEKLLTTTYPKVAPVSPLTPPTAPPLIIRNSLESPFDDEAPPTYEESLGGQSLQPPPLPSRHQRASSWNGTSIQSSQTPQFSQLKQISRSTSNATSEVSEAIGTAVKNLLSSFKPSTVERACHKTSYIWSRPVPSYFRPKSLSRQFKVIPKDKYSIQKGFHQNNYPSKELRSHDISEEDWQFFISGLNSIIGVNSIPGASNNFVDGFSVSLKWVSWMNVSMDERLMETNVKALNEYVNKWNEFFFIPRQIMIQFIDDGTKSTNPFKNQQHLLVKSI